MEERSESAVYIQAVHQRGASMYPVRKDVLKSHRICTTIHMILLELKPLISAFGECMCAQRATASAMYGTLAPAPAADRRRLPAATSSEYMGRLNL